MALSVLIKGRKSQCICCGDAMCLGDTELYLNKCDYICFQISHLPPRKFCVSTFSMSSQVFETNRYFINQGEIGV